MSTIHIIEPDTAILGGLTELLSSLALPVKGYTNPDEFLMAARRLTKGFLVVDFDAREVADFQFLQRLRELNVSLPTVLMSSRADNAFKARALNAGALDVIDKPLVNDILLARIRQYLPEAAEGISY